MKKRDRRRNNSAPNHEIYCHLYKGHYYSVKGLSDLPECVVSYKCLYQRMRSSRPRWDSLEACMTTPAVSRGQETRSRKSEKKPIPKESIIISPFQDKSDKARKERAIQKKRALEIMSVPVNLKKTGEYYAIKEWKVR